MAGTPELSVSTLAGMIHDPALLCVDTRGILVYGSATCPAR